jgi:stearoyl-CoA desaturase (Delta-9 desaturase)
VTDAAARRTPTTRAGAPRSRGATTGRSVRIGIPFVAVHLACLAVFFVGWSPVALLTCIAFYVPRAFGITVFYHRGLSHRAFRMSRLVRTAGAVLGASAAQRGPLWWVAHHRIHHRYTDREGDPHSPVVEGMWRSHLLWLFDAANQPTAVEQVPDLVTYPEMRVLDRFHHLVSGLTAACAFLLGTVLARVDPGLGTSGLQLFVWGFCLSTVALYHSTFAVNSVGHRFGRRPFATNDASRNNWVVSFLTLGEGWHNNHHRCPNSARQGFARGEPDPGWWVIRAMAVIGAVSEVRPIPARILAERDATCALGNRRPARSRSRRISSIDP